MKSKRHIAVLLTVAALAAVIFTVVPPSEYEKLAEPYTIWIGTDMHYLSPALCGDGHFFSTPRSTGDGKVVHYSDELTRAFLQQAADEQPDLVVLTGDLTLNGALRSHEELVGYLHELQNSGVQVLVLPGNHDISAVGGDYSGEEIELVEGLSPERYAELYAPFGWQQAVSRDETSMSYFYEATDKLRILMLDVNLYTKGFVRNATLQWLEQELSYCQKNGIKVIAASHQNLYAHNELLSFGYQMYSADKVTPLYEEYGVKANFSGHIHVQSIVRDMPVPEIVTASMAVMPTAYGVVEYDGKGFSYTAQSVDVAAWAAAEGIADENLLDFGEYAEWYFEEVARNQVRARFAQSDPNAFTQSELTAEEIELLANTFAEINSAYFSGVGADGEAHAEGLALWRSLPEAGFHLSYFDTMLAAAEKDMLRIEFG